MSTVKWTPKTYPVAVILVGKDGSQTEFPLYYPPQATGFTFRVAVNEVHSIKYNCWAQAKPIRKRGMHDAGAAESP